jgi:hypothetical protein
MLSNYSNSVQPTFVYRAVDVIVDIVANKLYPISLY